MEMWKLENLLLNCMYASLSFFLSLFSTRKNSQYITTLCAARLPVDKTHSLYYSMENPQLHTSRHMSRFSVHDNNVNINDRRPVSSRSLANRRLPVPPSASLPLLIPFRSLLSTPRGDVHDF